MSVRLGVVGCGSVFWTPYMSLIERLRGQGRVEVAAVYDADPEQAPARPPSGSTCRADLPDDAAVCEHPDVDAVLVLTSMNEHGRLARAGARGRQARARREADGDHAARRPSRCSRPPRPRPGTCVCAPHILLSPTYRAMHARVRGGRDRRRC